MEEGRLVYYQSAADTAYWDEHWQKSISPTFYTAAARGRTSRALDRIFERHLPREGRILEAGCGLGQVVLALRVRGYDVEGVEWGERTVAMARSVRDDLPIRVGDVTALDVPDGHYAGYVSLGVMEHRREGPEPFLAEALRVLRPGGIACISVPSLYALRRCKARLGLYRGRPEGMQFYQYVYPRAEFSDLVRAAGFEIVGSGSYAGYMGLREEIPLLRLLIRWRVGRGLFRRLLEHRRWVDDRCGHMLMVVARKPDAA